MGKSAAVLAAAFLLVVLGFWLLTRAPDPVQPVSAPEAASAPGAQVPPVAPGTTLTSTGTETFVFRPTAEPAPAKTAPTYPPPGFEQTLKKAEGSLPTQAQLGKLRPKETHNTPALLFKAGTEIGKVAEAIEKDPSLAPQGMDFYAKCARRADLSTSVRALCLGNMRDLGRDRNIAFDEEGVDPKIKSLADKLNEK